MGTLVTTEAAEDTPVTLAEAQVQCRMGDITDHDTLLARLIDAATAEYEQYAGITLVSRTMTLYLDGFGDLDVDLQTYPVQSVGSVKYDDADNSEQILGSSSYFTKLQGMSPYIRAVDYWPSAYTSKPSSVRVEFVAGYQTVDAIPDDAKQAILVRVLEMFEAEEGTHHSKLPGQSRRRFN